MKTKLRQDRAWLLATARAVAEELKFHSKGTRLRIRIPSRTITTDTDGWSAVIGDLGKNRPWLELWLDRFSGYPERKLYSGFCSDVRPQIIAVTKRVSSKLWPSRIFSVGDITQARYLFLTKRLGRSNFNTPILEKYYQGLTYYGIYDPTRATSQRVNSHICARAVAFFADVASALPHAVAEDEHREVYPRYENRKRVAAHLRRERSHFLATECKIRDDYVCQVCGLRFEDLYGRLGIEFSEAHHRVPLSQLRENVRTSIEDLATVCANCHRMLHRMSGKRDDIAKLRTIVRRHQRTRR